MTLPRVGFICLILTQGCASLGQAIVAAAAASASPLSSGYRIVAPATVTESSPQQMIERLSRADVVFFGDQHDDPETHRAEAELLDAIGRTGRTVVLSLEMFERDVQPVLDNYLAGRVSESEFLARSRPWERYATDYRRLIELAKQHHWRVVAANVPRRWRQRLEEKALRRSTRSRSANVGPRRASTSVRRTTTITRVSWNPCRRIRRRRRLPRARALAPRTRCQRPWLSGSIWRNA